MEERREVDGVERGMGEWRGEADVANWTLEENKDKNL